MNGILDDLILNWHHTGIHLLPVDDWTMAKQGSKNVVIKGSDDKWKITVVLAVTLTGCFMHPLILYDGKTDKAVIFLEGWDVSHTWSNEVSMIYKIAIPFLKSTRVVLKLPQSQSALAVFDVQVA